jgi:hypothetical protein
MRAAFKMDWRVQACWSRHSAHAGLGVDILRVVGEHEEGIVIEEILDDRAEERASLPASAPPAM